MSHPDLVTARLEDEDVVATVNLSGDDALIVTPTRTLLYEGEGILSDESVTEYPHDIAQVDVTSGRRKTRVELTYPIEGTKSLSVPKERLGSVLHYLLAGILNVNGITGPGEAVRAVYRFNELTLIITSKRVVTSVGASVWDGEFDEYQFADLTGLEFEEGSVATQIVLYINGRSQRIKAPKRRAEEVKQDLREAVFEFYNVESMSAFESAVESDSQPDTETADADTGIVFDDAVRPLSTSSDETVESDDPDVSTDSWPYVEDEQLEPASAVADPVADAPREEVEAALETLQAAIDDQRDTLDAQEAAIEELIELLSPDQ